MATLLDRLLLVQGGCCFFCEQPLSKEAASVEHLLAISNGGKNEKENRVACCKAVNALFGDMSLRDKFKAVLNQKNGFKCPTENGGVKPQQQPAAASKPKDDRFLKVVENLKGRGNSRPGTLKTLAGTVASIFPKKLKQKEIDALIQQLKDTGKICVHENKVTYSL